MQFPELYQQLLSIEDPWRVTRVDVDVPGGRVDVFVEIMSATTTMPCATCGIASPLYDQLAERTWRHLDTCQLKTFVRARPRRVKCKEHGVLQTKMSWSEVKSRFTMPFERLAIDVMKVCDVNHAAAILRISWDEAFGIRQRAVARGLARRGDITPTRMGVDDKSPGRGTDAFTVVSDLTTKTVVWIGDGARKETLAEYYNSRSKEALAAIECVAMDMSSAYASATLAHVPDARGKIVYDRFHVMQLATKAVDLVRRNESFRLARDGDTSLHRTRYVWLFSEENLTDRHREKLAALRGIDLQTGVAWAYKENLRHLWSQPDLGSALTCLDSWLRAIRTTALQPLLKLASTISDHSHNILTYLKHRVTSAVPEGLNAAIQALKTSARGYRNRANFKSAIFFRLGGLDLYPVAPLHFS